MSVDGVTPFLIESANVQGAHVHLGSVWRALIAARHYPQPIVAALGQLAAFAALLSARLKHPTRITIQAQGKGPVPLWVVDLSAQRELRAMAQRRDPALPLADSTPFAELLGENGQLALIMDLPATHTPFVTLFPYQGKELSDALETFIAQSDQRDTRLLLAADNEAAAGILLQKLPDATSEDPDGWQRVTLFANTTQPDELRLLTAQQLLHRLFAAEQVRTYPIVAILPYQRLDPQRIHALLRLLGREEVEQLINETGAIEIHDELSGQTYRLTRAEAYAALATDADSSNRVQ